MNWQPLVIGSLALLCAAAVGLAGFLLAQRSGLRRERDGHADRADRLTAERDELAQQRDALRAELGELQTQIAVFKEQQAGFEQRTRDLREQFESAQRQARETFRSLASETLSKANEQFLHLAKKSFEGEQKDAVAQLEQRKTAIKTMVDPIRELLEKYGKSVQEIEAGRKQAYGALREQLAGLMEDQRRLRTETQNLVQALRRPEVRGRWGEIQLRRVAELAGMIANCDFYEQEHLGSGDGGSLRPDMVVRLPGDRCIVVDAKTPIDAFLSAVEATSDDDRDRLLAQHARQIDDQVGKLAAKGYPGRVELSPDFVVLFIPGESFLQAAVQRRPDLLDSAMNRGVVIATPSTLVSLLKVVALGWREQQVAENARRISDLGRELHERIATATGHLEKMGRQLEGAVKAYNQFVGSFESRVLSSARRFKELGADSPKELPAEGAVSEIELQPREVRSAEAPGASG